MGKYNTEKYSCFYFKIEKKKVEKRKKKGEI